MPGGEARGFGMPPSSLFGVPRVGALLGAAGEGDLDAFGAFYDRTAPVVFGLLRAALVGDSPAEQATERVYLSALRGAPLFEPAHDSAFALLLRAVAAELARRGGADPDGRG